MLILGEQQPGPVVYLSYTRAYNGWHKCTMCTANITHIVQIAQIANIAQIAQRKADHV